ncbi:hypothetical protein ACFVGW_03535 [Streptomyces sp. NPDC127129]|uniref:hypothetical protein n=1 Tax=Streptomyces sp. NPDC127129 TaxID=3345373 RepID=UPI0036262BBE
MTSSVALVERHTPPDGYRRASEALRQAARPSMVDLAIAEAVERQTAAMRELTRRPFPEADVVADGVGLDRTPAGSPYARSLSRR